ncbi:MAG: XTP/dITP diphosphatase [Christensenellales bacterium]
MNDKLVIASGNKGKIAEIKSILGPFFKEIISQVEAGLDIEVDETGSTFQENALLKAREAAKLLGTAVIADDSGLCVDCLGGAPGVLSARYAGPQHDDEDNRQRLIKECAAFKAPRTARFVSAVALVFPGGEELLATGSVEGEILLEPKGDGGFGYDCLFYYPPFGKTFAEISFDEKNEISHRRMALMKLKVYFEGKAE